VGGSQGRCGHYTKNLLFLPKSEPRFLGRLVRNLVTELTELSWFKRRRMKIRVKVEILLNAVVRGWDHSVLVKPR
jgi:hypothetical protein